MQRPSVSAPAWSDDAANVARNLRVAAEKPHERPHGRPQSRFGRVEWPAVQEQGIAPERRIDAPPIAPRAVDAAAASPAAADVSDLDAVSVPDAAARARIVGELYASYYHRVFCFTRRFVRDEEAEEVAHEAFVRLLRVRNLERMSISVAYLLRIAENLLKRRHERAARYKRILEESGAIAERSRECGQGEIPGGGSCSDTGAAAGLLVDATRLEGVLAQLTREEQAAVRLIVCEGLDYQAAARSLGVPVSTINNWKHRGLSKLKQLIGRPGFAAAGSEPRAVG